MEHGRGKQQIRSSERHPAILADALTGGAIGELTEAMCPFSVPDKVLVGNIASAINGAVRVLDKERPNWTDRTHAIREALLRQPALAGSSTTTADGQFRRRSCCLIYRAAPNASGAICGDCVLHDIRD